VYINYVYNLSPNLSLLNSNNYRGVSMLVNKHVRIPEFVTENVPTYCGIAANMNYSQFIRFAVLAQVGNFVHTKHSSCKYKYKQSNLVKLGLEWEVNPPQNGDIRKFLDDLEYETRRVVEIAKKESKEKSKKCSPVS
jgi:hypothetical protein